MSKAKYRSSYQALARKYSLQHRRKLPIQSLPGVGVDRILSYDRLQAAIKMVDVGTLLPLPAMQGETIPGIQRQMDELLKLMAERALTTPYLRDSLSWLNGRKGHLEVMELLSIKAAGSQ